MKRQTAVLLGVVLYVPLVVYPPLRLISWLFEDLSGFFWILLLLPNALIFPPYISRRVRARLSRVLAVSLMTWYCLMIQLSLVVVLMELVRLWSPLNNTSTAIISFAAWLILAATSLYGALNIKVHRLTIPNKRGTLGKSLIQISDVHIGTRSSWFLQRIVKKILSLEPDVVLITGDLVDASSVDSTALSPLAELNAPVFFCTGNHERLEHCEDIVTWLQEHKVTVLRNQSVDLEPFQFIGLEDQDSADDVSNALAALEPKSDRYRVLLRHKPEGIERAVSWGVDLMLCGHTHHGQIFPFGLIVKRTYNPYRGKHQFGQMTLYISPGTGTTGPLLRLGTRNEITLLQFV
ncbi:MAG: metallophosphoesterase [Gammaproteobacteria bacterium]|nr:metallophosphoesterase [Gammaproteobacteria bacterium]